MNKEFDKFIKNKFEGREFEFKDAYWAEAETMFTNAAPKAGLFQKIGGWWSVFGATGLVVAGLGLAVLKPSKTIDNQLSSTKNTTINTVLEDDMISPITTDNDSDNSNESQLIDQQSIDNESIAPIKNTTTSLSTEKAGVIGQKRNANSAVNIDKKVSGTILQEKRTSLSQKEGIVVTSNNSTVGSKTIDTTPSTNIESNVVNTFKTDNNTSNRNNGIINKSADTKKSSVNNTPKGGVNTSVPTVINQENESVVPYKTADKIATKPIATINKTDKEEQEIIRVIDNIDALSSPIFAVINEESLEAIRKYKVAQQEKARRFLSFGIIGGVGSSTPYGEVTSNALTYSPLGGIKAGYSLNKKWTGHLSVIAYSRDVNLMAESSNTTYGFGVQQTTTQVLVNRLDYVEIPFYLTRKLNTRQELVLGVSYAHLLTTSGELLNWQSDSHTKRSLVSNTTEKGYMPGLNRHDFSLLIGYQYNVSPRLSVGAHLKYGLQDITQNNYYNNNNLDRNLQVRFVAAYDILSRNL